MRWELYSVNVTIGNEYSPIVYDDTVYYTINIVHCTCPGDEFCLSVFDWF